MIELAIASGKGGVGKSTLSATVAIHLSKKDKKVVAVDADADAPNLHLVLGTKKWLNEDSYSESMIARINQDKCIRCGECAKACTYKAIHRESDGRFTISSVMCEGCLTCTLVCPVKGAITRTKVESGKIKYTVTEYGFPLISASLNPGRPNSGKIVTEERERAKKIAKKDSIIVIDSAAGVGCQVVSSIVGVNMSILITEPTPASFSDLKRVLKLARHFMQPVALVINKYDINPKMTEELENFARENNIYLLGKVPYDPLVPKSMAEMTPIIVKYPNSKAAKALLKIAEETYNILSNWKSWFVKYRPRKPVPYIPIIISPKRKE